MKTFSFHAAYAAIVAAMLLSCGGSHSYEHANSLSSSDSTGYESIPMDTSFSKVNTLFIRTAALKCKVNDVQCIDQYIIAETKKRGGYIEFSNKNTEELSTNIVETSEDSIKEVKTIQTTAHYTIRIPDEIIDEFLFDVESKSDFIHFKKTTATDVGVDVKSNQLKMANRTIADKRNAGQLETRKGNVEQYMNASNLNLINNDEFSDLYIDNARTYSKVNLSELTIDIYQNENLFVHLKPNTTLTKFNPSYFSEAFDSLRFGWKMIRSFSLFLLNLWPMIILGIAIVFLVKSKRIRTI